jgi:Mn2+/Fe2+ NRAMP family transporter
LYNVPDISFNDHGVISPILIALILLLANNKNIMGTKTNSPLSNALGFLTLIIMSAAAIAFVLTSF